MADLTPELILQWAKSDQNDDLQKLLSCARSGTLRDHDSLFESKPFYITCVYALTSAWNDYDRHHLGGWNDTDLFSFDNDEDEDDIGGEMNHTPSMSASMPSGGFLGTGISIAISDKNKAPIAQQTRELEEKIKAEQKQKQDEKKIRDEKRNKGGGRLGSPEECERSWTRLSLAYQILTKVLSLPEVQIRHATANQAVDTNFVDSIMERFEPKFAKKMPTSRQPLAKGVHTTDGVPGTATGGTAGLISLPISMAGPTVRLPEPASPKPPELALLRGLLHMVYMKCIHHRSAIRNHIANFFQKFLRNPSYPQGLVELLAITASFIRGLQTPIKRHYVDWILRNVMPLHMPNTNINELSPTLSVYHEALVYTITQFLTKDNVFAEPVVTRVLSAWPTARAANSNKEVLLLHEMDSLMGYVNESSFKRIYATLMPLIIQSITSFNHRVAERALQLWQNDKFVTLSKSIKDHLIPTIFPVLMGEQHWNKSVNKMRGTVLQILHDMDLPLFTKCCENFWHQHDTTETTTSDKTPLQRTLEKMHQMRPDDEVKQSEEQRLLTTQVHIPQALDNIKYSEFVFGHSLGEGSFSSVVYAKRIQRTLPPSQWPEYAVKIINKTLMAQHNYDTQIEREISIMSRLTHPNITRLIGRCSNDQNIYLILEYAHRGDLHTAITTRGSLDINSVKFVTAEMVRALEYIHQQQIVYGDMKPENVLIHQSGHIKLGDFGSARDISDIRSDDRIEGTADYLAPEVIRGHGVSYASDLWALGCVIYQMLAGRTPMWAGDDIDTPHLDKKQKHDNDETTSASQHSDLFDKIVRFELDDDKFPDDFPPLACSLVEKLLVVDPTQRLGLNSSTSPPTPDYTTLKQHPFFEGVDWERIHTMPAPTLAGGTVAAAPDAKWARRKNSIMWSPMPKTYTFTDTNYILDIIPESDETSTSTHTTTTSSRTRLAPLPSEEDEDEDEDELPHGNDLSDDEEEEFNFEDEENDLMERVEKKHAASSRAAPVAAALPPKPSSRATTSISANALPPRAVGFGSHAPVSVTSASASATPIPTSGAKPPQPLRSALKHTSVVQGAPAPGSSAAGGLPLASPLVGQLAGAGQSQPAKGALRKPPSGTSTSSALLARMMGGKPAQQPQPQPPPS